VHAALVRASDTNIKSSVQHALDFQDSSKHILLQGYPTPKTDTGLPFEFESHLALQVVGSKLLYRQ